ncbi:DnaB-like helicase C-terminal domain-containing protein [uncultured Cohaesibacter sp.]|uniref:DnaB-like helicase C-terminal domain-containing protein n=1 Tax=uncultured Cohaesibacter sp. TaxID=1002546 RepID=UPI0029C733CC|nr:DnaB-like helicase C-terminal domain-containing protein [uncultured Cohaesibacter sp.]
MNDENPIVQTHLPCPDCGSSDALSMRADGSTYCFSCEKNSRAEGDAAPLRDDVNPDFASGFYEAITARSITEETARFWSYMMVRRNGSRTHCANYLDANRNVVAQKFRTRDKQFPWVSRKGFTGLYGQWLWRSGGKMVVITEGEIDAMSVSQAQNNRYPVASLPDGGGNNAVRPIKEAMPWLLQFDKIVLFFDNDEKGRATVDVVKKMLPPGKCYITYAPEGFKDANDLLKANKRKTIIDLIYEAKQYRPDGIVSGAAVIKRMKDRPDVVSYPYPDDWETLNFKALGIRLGELDTWTSGTGMGKTTIIKALQNHFFHTTELNQALIHLEEPLEDTGEDLVSYEIGKRVGLDPALKETDEYAKAQEDLFLAEDAEGNPRLQLYDAFGSLEEDNLYDIIRFMAVSGGCKVFWLDHLSILVSNMGDEGGDERKRLDAIMHNLKSLTVELNIYIGLICHLRKPPGGGKSFEEGAVPTLDDLRGSGGIKQLSNSVFAISRNQQAETATARNTSTLTVLKCRKTGRTGTADHLLFNDVSGRLELGQDPEMTSRDAFDDEGPKDY